MTTGERERRELQEALVSTIGTDQTDTLMHYLPPVGWADVATKHDLHTLETALRSEIAGVRGDMDNLEERLRGEITGMHGEITSMHGEITGMRGEITGMRGEITSMHGEIIGIRGDMDNLEERLRGEMEGSENRLRTEIAELRGDLHRELRLQFYWTATLLALFLTAFVGAIELI